MHKSVLNFVRKHVKAQEVNGKQVLEVGALDVNGNVTNWVLEFEPNDYIRTDMRPGPNVDHTIDACELVNTFGNDEFHLVLCLETLEHIQNWTRAVVNMKAVTKPGGCIILTTRSEGFALHDYPEDYWRFSVETMAEIFSDWCIEVVEADPEVAGVFLKARKPLHGWHPKKLWQHWATTMKEEDI